ncbi:MAG: DCC1-like thiol-disulfide oxidoreductase family protein [Pseudomonadota bacterium]
MLADLDPVALVDGECALCAAAAQRIHKLDRSGTIRLLPVQSARGRAAFTELGLDPDDPDTWLFVAGGRVWRDLDGVIALGRFVGGWGRLASVLRLLPAPLRRGLYRAIATRRIRLFGKGDLCALPDPGLRARIVT